LGSADYIADDWCLINPEGVALIFPKVTKAQWQKMGFNDSAEHTDIVSTTDRTVTAVMTDGGQKVIYKAGMFVI